MSASVTVIIGNNSKSQGEHIFSEQEVLITGED